MPAMIFLHAIYAAQLISRSAALFLFADEVYYLAIVRLLSNAAEHKVIQSSISVYKINYGGLLSRPSQKQKTNKLRPFERLLEVLKEYA